MDSAFAAISLRPAPIEKPDDDKLSALVERLNRELDGFRHMSEDALMQGTTRSALGLQDGSAGQEKKPEDEKGSAKYVETKGVQMFEVLT